MKQWILMAGALLALTGCAASAHRADRGAAVQAVMADGRQVLLYENNSWEPMPVPTADRRTVPEHATQRVRSDKGIVELWYDPANWQLIDRQLSPVADFSLALKGGEAYAMVIAERIGTRIETLKQVVIANARAAAPDLKVVAEAQRRHGDVELLELEMAGTVQDIPFSYLGRYWAGPEGNIQVLAFTGSSLLDEHRAAFDQLLDGIVILAH